jgi:uncharacterized protein (DUF2252 family)
MDAAERAAAGKALRKTVPRTSHGHWSPAGDRPDPRDVLAQSAEGRIPGLIPIRNQRMSESAFAFYRGSAAVMACDLATTANTGVTVQACGDAHCMNFGAFATPERRLIFDVNDFDETLPGPWEWDVKRLAASLVLAGRSIPLKAGDCEIAVLAGMRSYRMHMASFAAMHALELWYARVDTQDVIAKSSPADRKRRLKMSEEAMERTNRAAVEKLTVIGPDGRRRFKDEPPLLYHATDENDGGFDVEAIVATYRQTIAPDVRVLFDRFRLVDCAIKVVGVGSVGTRCAVALFVADDDDTLLLQIKEANASVLERYVGPSVHRNHGERVVFGQRLMQSASDLFLGWGSSGEFDFYIRQFRDMKSSVDISVMDSYQLREYAHYCGRALAMSHARSGDAATISGYLGKTDRFDKALVQFANAYADQAERDYEAFVAAIKAGLVPVAES